MSRKHGVRVPRMSPYGLPGGYYGGVACAELPAKGFNGNVLSNVPGELRKAQRVAARRQPKKRVRQAARRAIRAWLTGSPSPERVQEIR